MADKRFTEQMQAYGKWKEDLISGINDFQKWLDANQMGGPEDELRIYESLGSLRSDKLTIAFVAEFARGKTELINAIFFSEYDRRLLPSEAGRTTMCPTELFYDIEHKQAYIRLLPIETRLSETSIAEYKLEPIHWTSIDLELDNPDSMAEAFQEIACQPGGSAEAGPIQRRRYPPQSPRRLTAGRDRYPDVAPCHDQLSPSPAQAGTGDP